MSPLPEKPVSILQTATGEEILSRPGIQILFIGRQGFLPRCNEHVIAAMDEYWKVLYRYSPPEPYPKDEEKDKRRENCRSKQLTEFMEDYCSQFGPVHFWKLHESEDRRMDREQDLMTKTFVDITTNPQVVKGSLRTMMTTSMLKAKKRRLDQLGLLFPPDAYKNRPKDEEGNYLPILPDHSLSSPDIPRVGAVSDDDHESSTKEVYASHALGGNEEKEEVLVDTPHPEEEMRLLEKEHQFQHRIRKVREQQKKPQDQTNQTGSHEVQQEEGDKSTVSTQQAASEMQLMNLSVNQLHPSHMPPPPPQYRYAPPAPANGTPCNPAENIVNPDSTLMAPPPSKRARQEAPVSDGSFESVRRQALYAVDQWERSGPDNGHALRNLKKMCADGFRRDIDDITKSYHHQIGHRQIAIESASSLKAREAEFVAESQICEVHAAQIKARINSAENDMFNRFHLMAGQFPRDHGLDGNAKRLASAPAVHASGMNSVAAQLHGSDTSQDARITTAEANVQHTYNPMFLRQQEQQRLATLQQQQLQIAQQQHLLTVQAQMNASGPVDGQVAPSQNSGHDVLLPGSNFDGGNGFYRNTQSQQSTWAANGLHPHAPQHHPPQATGVNASPSSAAPTPTSNDGMAPRMSVENGSASSPEDHQSSLASPENNGMAALFSAIEQQEDDETSDESQDDDEPTLDRSEFSSLDALVSATEKEKESLVTTDSPKTGKRRRSKGTGTVPKINGKANNHAQSRARVKRSWILDPSEREYQEHYDKNVDVLLGRGGLAGANPGNKAYMAKARELFRSSYRSAKKENKKQISMQLVEYVESRGGKFMAYDEDEKKWFPVHPNRAREKASQALRECEKRRPSNSEEPLAGSPSTPR